ncbi:hypothetical protein V8D89_003177 [Ganoderma adspersum]
MCRSLTELINHDVYIQTKIELARSGRIDGASSAAITVADRLASLRELRARTLDCFMYSLSTGRPHPNASQSRISLSLASEGWQSDYWDSILILGDLIAWNVPNLNGRRCQMRVINWKTGIIAWEFHHDLWSRCRLISQSHVVVVAFESLLVYPIDRHLKTPSAHSTPHTALCVLQLPAWSSIGSSRSLLVESYIQFPPPLGPNDRPLYCHDPELTLLTLEIHYIVDVPYHASEFVQYALFIPISTIKARVALATPSPPPPPPPPLHDSHERGGLHAVALVPWADWGPAGTRLVHLASEGPCRFSPMGGSCAVTHRRRDPSGGDLLLRVLVFDVHPWARPDAHSAVGEKEDGDGDGDGDEEGGGEWRRFLRVTEGATRAGRAFTESLRTHFPFDVTRRDIPLAENERYPTVVLAEDGLLLVDSPFERQPFVQQTIGNTAGRMPVIMTCINQARHKLEVAEGQLNLAGEQSHASIMLSRSPP